MSTLPESTTPLTDATEADLKKDGYSTEAFPLSAVLARSRRLERSRDEWRDIAEMLADVGERIVNNGDGYEVFPTKTNEVVRSSGELFNSLSVAIAAFNALKNKL